MYSKAQLTVSVPDGALTGEMKFFISRWTDDGNLIETCKAWEGVCILPTIQEAGSHYQWAVTAIREAADRAVASLLEQMSAEQVKPMLDCEKFNNV